MDWNRVEGNWKQMKGKVKEQWGKLTDDDLDVINGKREQLEGKIQERYGYEKDRTKKDIDDWYGRQGWERKDPASAGFLYCANYVPSGHLSIIIPPAPDGQVIPFCNVASALHNSLFVSGFSARHWICRVSSRAGPGRAPVPLP